MTASTPASCWTCSSPASRGCLRTLWRGRLLGGEGLGGGMGGWIGWWWWVIFVFVEEKKRKKDCFVLLLYYRVNILCQGILYVSVSNIINGDSFEINECHRLEPACVRESCSHSEGKCFGIELIRSIPQYLNIIPTSHVKIAHIYNKRKLMKIHSELSGL